MLTIAINGFVVESEKESGYGRFDVVVYPKERRYFRYTVIFEVKKVENEEKLRNVAKGALETDKREEILQEDGRVGMQSYWIWGGFLWKES